MTLCGSMATPYLTPEDLAREDQWCCAGAAIQGPGHCTCWDPIYSEAQLPTSVGEPTDRRTRCFDCAFRPDSPERADGVALEAMPNFFCHQGMVTTIAYQHPDGRVRKAPPGHYEPPKLGMVPYKADGTPADRCAGWVQAQRAR